MARKELLVLVSVTTGLWSQQDWRTLPDKAVRTVLTGARSNGQVGSSFDFRVKSTDRSYNYKLRATWVTPGVVAGAVARSGMLTKGWSGEQAEAVLRAIEDDKSWIVLVELDPREGSGIIPRDWFSRFGPKGADDRKVAGSIAPDEGVWHHVISAFPRDYAYDRFLVRFPMDSDSKGVLTGGDLTAELLVQIYEKQGRVVWKVPPGIVK